MSSIIRFLLVSLIAGSNVLAQIDTTTSSNGPAGITASSPVMPAAAPEMPASAPEIPAVAPEIPAVAPEMPAAVPEMPAAAPEMPAAAPEIPSAAPEMPAAAPEMSAAAHTPDSSASPTQVAGDFEKNDEHSTSTKTDTPYVKGEEKDHSKYHAKQSGKNYEKNTLDEHSDWSQTSNTYQENKSKQSLDVKETVNTSVVKKESSSSSFKKATGTNCVGCKPEPECLNCIKPFPTPIVCTDCIKTCSECIPIPRPCYTCYEPEPVCLTCLIPVEVKKTCLTCVQTLPSFNPFIDIFGGLVNVKVVEKKTSFEAQLQAALQLLFKQNQKKSIIIQEVDNTFEKFIKKLQLELALIQELALKTKKEEQIKVLLLEPKFQPLCQTLKLTPSLIGGMSISALGQQINSARYQLANTAEITFGKYKSACESHGFGFAGIQSQYNGFGKFYQSVSSSISSSASASFFSSHSGSSSASILI